MFYLLPEKEKKILRREYLYRLTFVILCFVLGSLVVASVFLLPSYLISYRKLADVKETNTEIQQDIKAKTDPSLASFLAALKDNLGALALDNKTGSSSAYIKEITDKKTSGITIKQFFINYGDTGSSIIVNGNASTRDYLTRFDNDVKSISDFSNVDLPVSDFAPDKDLDFTMTITIKS